MNESRKLLGYLDDNEKLGALFVRLAVVMHIALKTFGKCLCFYGY